jgi:hypothetical protein
VLAGVERFQRQLDVQAAGRRDDDQVHWCGGERLGQRQEDCRLRVALGFDLGGQRLGGFGDHIHQRGDHHLREFADRGRVGAADDAAPYDRGPDLRGSARSI